jgi:hypothetical protein
MLNDILKSANRIKVAAVIVLFIVLVALSLITATSYHNAPESGVIALVATISALFGIIFALARKPLIASIIFLLGFILIVLAV